MKYNIDKKGKIRLETSLEEIHMSAVFRLEARNDSRYGLVNSMTPERFFELSSRDQDYNELFSEVLSSFGKFAIQGLIKRNHSLAN